LEGRVELFEEVLLAAETRPDEYEVEMIRRRMRVRLGLRSCDRSIRSSKLPLDFVI
jgi:hypothetical protein